MKRFLIHVSTYWCGMDDTFRAVAEDETQLWDLAEELAYQNFQSYGLDEEIAEDQGYNPDEMSEERIREELTKCFKCNTIETLEFLHEIPRLRDYIFERTNLWLKPTNEK